MTTRRFDALPAVLFLLVALAVSGAGAAVAECQEVTVSATAVDFGDYDALSQGSHDTVGTVQLICVGTPGATDQVELLLSSGLHAPLPQRTMLGPGSEGLEYNLYLDASRQVVWGNGDGGTGTLQVEIEQTLPTTLREDAIYGRIHGGQRPAPGLYSDSISVTVMF